MSVSLARWAAQRCSRFSSMPRTLAPVSSFQNLRQNGGQGRPLHSHAKQEDEDRIQHNIDHRSDQHRQHSRQGASLAADEGV